MGGRTRSESVSEYTSSWEPQVAETIRYKVQQLQDEHNKNHVSNHSTDGGVDGGDALLPPRPLMVAFAGLPGSGKSISSMLLAHSLEEMGIGCFVMPHDGYHMYLSQLRIMPHPADMIYRRGAPDTFEPHHLLRDLWRLRGDGINTNINANNNFNNGQDGGQREDIIKIPAFDHAKGDPEPDQHIFDRHMHKVVLCEGLYVLHDGDGWQEIADMFDFKIFMDTDLDECMERVKIRNLCIPGYTPDEIRERVDRVDRVNAMTVMQSKARADLIDGDKENSVSHVRVESSISLAALDLETRLAQGDTTYNYTSTTSNHNLNAYSDTVDTDWKMDFIRRPRGDSFASSTNLSEYGAGGGAGGEPHSVSVHTNSEPIGQVAGRWEPDMVERIITMMEEQGPPAAGEPFMVALAAGPGTGKSLSAMLIANALEERGFSCMVMPHDGYHYSLEYLRTFPDPQDAIYRRGAPDTFDPQALIRDLRRIRSSEEDIIKLPAFDHARADPEPDTHIFDRHRHRVVLCEGLYLLHDQDGWEDVADEFDLKIFMNANIDTCMERVKIRNTCIPGYTPEEIAVRVEKVDRVNALTVIRSKIRADVIVETMA